MVMTKIKTEMTQYVRKSYILDARIDVSDVIFKAFPKEKFPTISSACEEVKTFSLKELKNLCLELGQYRTTKDLSEMIITQCILYANKLISYEELCSLKYINSYNIK